MSATQGYILVFCAFSALFLSVQDGEPRNAAAYALAFAPVSPAIFFLALGRPVS